MLGTDGSGAWLSIPVKSTCWPRYFKEREGMPAGGCEGPRLPPLSAHFVTRANYPEPPERAIKDV